MREPQNPRVSQALKDISSRVRRYILTPLDYIYAGEDLRIAGQMGMPTEGPAALRKCVLEYLKYMQGRTLDYIGKNRANPDLMETISFPLLPETFRLFTALTKSDEDRLRQDPDFTEAWSILDDAISSQQLDGVFMGLYQPKAVAIVKDQTTKIELTGEVSPALEQIIGMEVK